MKRTPTLAAAVLATLPAFAMAQAPTSVELYGRLDLSMNYHRFGSTSTAPSSDRGFVSSDTSWLGLRGSENLGQGWRAYFKMEHGLNADTGAQSAATQFWNREVFIGLGSQSLGSLQIGSQFTPTLTFTSKIDPFRRSNTGAVFPLFQQGLAGPIGYPVQFNNSLQYISPNWGGLNLRLLAGVTEGVAPYGRPVSGSLDYTRDRLLVGGAFARVKLAGAAIGQPARPSITETTYELGATYRFDAFKLHGFFIRTDVDGGPGMKGGMLGASVPVGSGEIGFTAIRRDADDAANSDVNLLALQYTHFLSKRTWLYVGGARQANKGTAAYGIWPSRVDATGTGAPAAGADVSGVQLGMRHTF